MNRSCSSTPSRKQPGASAEEAHSALTRPDGGGCLELLGMGVAVPAPAFDQNTEGKPSGRR